MIKYINMQTGICPRCKELNITRRCSKSHLEKYHNIKIGTVYEITENVHNFMKPKNVNKDKKKVKIKREEKKFN